LILRAGECSRLGAGCVFEAWRARWSYGGESGIAAAY
jgi:hypothetical protein